MASWLLPSCLVSNPLLLCLISFSELFGVLLGTSAVCSFGGLITFASRRRIQEEDEICSAVAGTNGEDVFASAVDKLPNQMKLLHKKTIILTDSVAECATEVLADLLKDT